MCFYVKFTIFISLLSGLLFFYSAPAISHSSSEEEVNNNLTDLLEKIEDAENRKDIYGKYSETLNSHMIEILLEKVLDIFDKERERSEKITDIAFEIADFIKSDIWKGKVLLIKARFEVAGKKEYNPPSLKKALSIFRKMGDRKGEGACYYWQAVKVFSTGNVSLSLKFMEEADEFFHDSEIYRAHCYFFRGILYETLHREEGLEFYDKAFHLYEKYNHIPGITCCYSHIFNFYLSRGLFEEGEEILHRFKDFTDRADIRRVKEEFYIYPDFPEIDSKDDLLMEYYMARGNLYNNMGKYEEAIKSYKEVIERARKNGRLNKNVFMVYYSLPHLYLISGKKDMALKYLLQVLEDSTDECDINRIYLCLGDFYLKEMNDRDRALKCFNTVLLRSQKLESERYRYEFTGQALAKIGDLYMSEGHIDKALEEFFKGEENFKELYSSYNCGTYYFVYIYNKLGLAFQKKKDMESAFLYHTEALEYALNTHVIESEPAGHIIASSYKYLGNFYMERNRISDALNLYTVALKRAEKERNIKLEWEIYYETGKIYEKTGDWEKALRDYLKSINIIEHMRNDFTLEELKRDFMHDKIEVYEHIINLLVSMKREDEAFYFNEKARSRAFLDILSNRKIDVRHGADAEMVAEEEKLKNQIQYLSSYIRSEISKHSDSINIKEGDEKLKRLRLQYRELLEEIKMKNPEYMSLVSVNPFRLKEIQSFLDGDTLMLEYFLSEERVFLWITGRDSFNTLVIDKKREDIEKSVRKYREIAFDNISSYKIKDRAWKTLSQELYSILLKDGEKFMKGKKRLVICPQRILNYLPFNTLMDEKGIFTVEKYDISYVPSASILKFCQDKNTGKRERLLAFEPGDLELSHMPSLSETGEEIRGIAPLFPVKEIYSGKDMKTEVLYDRGKYFDILHMACHCMFEPDAPLFSGLIFSDRSLNVYEVFELDLNAYLVTLSACNTALSEDGRGDELSGLSLAFLYAGSPSVCSTLWNVSDEAASECMKKFYFYLQKNNKSESLRLAQIELMKKYDHPFFWAPFILTGDWK